MGRAGKRKDPIVWNQDVDANEICLLCGREMPPGSYDEHHLIPKTFGGSQTVRLHKICHDKLHHTFTEREMVNYYHTIERLKEDEQIRKFIKWVKKQRPDFYSKSKDTRDRRRKRK